MLVRGRGQVRLKLSKIVYSPSPIQLPHPLRRLPYHSLHPLLVRPLLRRHHHQLRYPPLQPASHLPRFQLRLILPHVLKTRHNRPAPRPLRRRLTVTLSRSLACTNIIESMNSVIRQASRNVKLLDRR